VEEEGAARKQEAGSEENEREVAETVLDPTDYVRKGLLNRNSTSSGLDRHDRSPTSQSPASRALVPSGGSVDNDTGTFQVPFTRIRSYVSPLQLERFENFRFKNPKPDDLPYKTSTPSHVARTSERESLLKERENKPIGWPSNKRRRLDRPMEVIPHINSCTMASVTGGSIGTSLKEPDQGDDNQIGVVTDDNGTDELSSGLAAVSANQPRYGVVKRRSFSKTRTLRESTTPSSTSDIMNPHVAPSKIAQKGVAKHLAQRSPRSCSVPATSSAASSFEDNQEHPHLSTAAIKHRRRRKKKPLTTHRHNRQLPTSQAPEVEVEEKPPDSSDQVYEVSRILTHDYVDNVRYYQVSWAGFPETEENLTWLTEEELQGASQILRRYLRYLETGIDDSDDERNEIEEEDITAIKGVLAEEGIV